MIKAVIFDMDGLLIDSEPLWKQAEIKVFNEVGVPLTREMTNKTMGIRLDEVVEFWHSRYPWYKPAKKEVERRVVDELIKLIEQSGSPMSGVDKALKVIDDASLPMAIASSSNEEIIDAVLLKLGIRGSMEVVHSAQHEDYGKPHPAVYMSTAQKLGVKPEECLALEDSVNGVISAKAAKMTCIAVPEPNLRGDSGYGASDKVIDSLEELTQELIADLNNR